MGDRIIYSMHRVGKVYPGPKQVLRDISLSYFYGAKIGVLGYNGSGKSTLLKIMAGVDHDFIGEANLSKGYRVGYLEQDPKIDPTKTVKEIVQEGAKETMNLLKEYEEISAKLCEEMSDDKMNTLLEKQATLQDKLDSCGAWDLDSRLDLAMDSLRCPPPETLVGVLSGGEKRRVALCRLLLQEPDILLLDEPTNHLDAETVLWLEQHLKNYKGTVIAVTHDRYFLDNVAGWILELDRGYGIPFEGNYSAWLAAKEQRLKVEEKQESKRQKSMSEELEWIRSSPHARHAKSKARIANYDKMLESDNREKRNVTADLYMPPGPRLGELVIDADNLMKVYGDRILFEKLSFKVPRGGIVGIIGPNGAGKTTLFRMIVGELKPDSGTVRLGDTVKLSYVDQSRDLDPQTSVLQTVSEGRDMIKLGKYEVNARAWIGKFNFTGDDQLKKICELSGGEKNRVHLAKMLKTEGNVLLLDEPTNDLDVNTLRALEDAIRDFPGCIMVISHDRYFLDRIATHILAFEDEGKTTWFDGNFSQYEEDRLARLGDAGKRPHRIVYKKLKRD
jgi:ATP-binding cassette ChvD family protein